MNRKEYKELLAVSKRAALAGGKVALRYFRKLKSVSLKEGAGLVSEADREAEAIIIKTIHKKYPHHRFLGEEGGFSGLQDSAGFWVIDPLDGTTNYVHGFPFFCVSIGFECHGVTEVGVVYAPLMDYMFTATRGGGAFLNGKKISVSSTQRIEDSLVATGFSYQAGSILENELRNFRYFAERCRGIRRAGSAALDMCMVASGIFDGFWERQLAPWDTAAGALIVQEAGGLVSNFDGDKFHFTMKSVVAANPSIHKVLVDGLRTEKKS
jgi:myo-inositol-1(or 4)-monophosphatase